MEQKGIKKEIKTRKSLQRGDKKGAQEDNFGAKVDKIGEKWLKVDKIGSQADKIGWKVDKNGRFMLKYILQYGININKVDENGSQILKE